MNKTKKIAMAAVSVVMAGAMLVPMAACGNKGGNQNKEFNTNWDEKPTLDAAYTPKLDDNGKIVYDKNTITLNMNVGNKNDKKPQSIAYRGGEVELSGEVTMPDGKKYSNDQLKPAWAALKETLGIDFADKYTNLGNTEQVSTPINNKTIGDYDIITSSLEAINTYADSFLDLNDYMYYMPNYKAFLKANPVAMFSLTGGENGEMFAAPYFDGNNDIEKYELAKREWVRIILDGADVSGATTTFAAQAAAKVNQKADGTKSAAKSYMGETGKWTVDTTNPGNEKATLTLTVDYDAALTAAKDANSDLGKAVAAAAGKTYDGTSGNIVELQNFAIDATSGAVTGAQLMGILREYVKVAYKDGDKSFYNGATYGSVTTKLSDVFNSSYAAWDVDLLVGMMRCVVTGMNLFDQATIDKGLAGLYGLTGRQDTTQRTVDLYALAGELYGIRGMESRYEYLYFDKDGNLKDNRNDADTYNTLAKMGAMADEGLLYVCATGDLTKGTAPNSAKTSYARTDSLQAFMMHDYVQTQTKPAIDGSKVNEGYDFSAVATPVSKWDTDSDGTRETTMRFTESWRSVKNTGFCIPKAAVENKPERLSAVLAFVDYLFSADGQILMTYGEVSTNGNTNPNGWWYAKESTKAIGDVATVTVEATNYSPAQYAVKPEFKESTFIYKGKVYEGMAYADRNIPIMTTANKDFYLGGEVNGVKQNSGNVLVSAKGSYTDYARKIVGTTLPIGNKDQGFEYQATADCGLDGARKVATAINNGSIKHVKLEIALNESLWYLSAPTMLPLEAGDRTILKNETQTKLSGTIFCNNSDVKTHPYTNVYTDLLYYGFDSTHYICGYADLGGMKADGAAYVAWLNQDDVGLKQRFATLTRAWGNLDDIYNITK